MKARPAPGARPGLAQAHLCLQLEKQVRDLAREKGFYENSVQVARRRLRDALEAFLLQDYSTAQVRCPLAPRVSARDTGGGRGEL